ncbi:hypothetical protein FSP39_017945 [Pinctada imbricata]|uniref:Protein inturned n=1 Tax=Pinctada imbricata TaxID=66713 RepID=A0AA88YET1_PINIB|nr:hypothetical protein FSP39_017945 [Pinctada imbricata]
MAYFSGNGPFYDPDIENKSLKENSMQNPPLYEQRQRATGARPAPETRKSLDKVQEGWRKHVHKQGDLFYVEVNDPAQGQLNSYQGFRDQEVNNVDNGDLSDEYVSLQSVQYPTLTNGYSDTEKRNSFRNNNRGKEHNNNHIQLQNGKKFKPKILFSDRKNEVDSHSIGDSPSLSRSIGSYSPSQQQNSPKSSKIKHVYLLPNLRNCRNGENSGIVLCERLFGIILCQYNSKSLGNSGNLERIVRDRKVIVQDVVPGSGAELCGQIHRGDMLVCVDDEEISWLNLDLIFRSVPNTQMKLTFQAPLVVGPKQSQNQRIPPMVPPKPYLNSGSNSPALSSTPTLPVKKRPPMGEDILYLVTGEEKPGSSVFIRNCLCTVMYLTLDTPDNQDSGKDDILYHFPADCNKLTEIRGLFLTLCGVVPDITGDQVNSCAMDYEGVKINMMFLKDGQDLFVLGAPESRIPPFTLSVLMSELQQTIWVLFGSISSAFRTPKNRSQLDQLFSLALHSALQNPEIIHHGSLTSHASKAYADSLTGARKLNLSDDNKLLCDEILSEFEAADFDDYLEESRLHERRSYNILGSCLFYKDYLLCSHLQADELRDVHLFIKHHCLLHLVCRQTVEELVIWREVYPKGRGQESSPPGYPQPRGRCYLLIVGRKHLLLSTLLEVGGCSKSSGTVSGPDPFYVGQAKATLLQFESDDTNIRESCENRLNSELHGPSLVSADSILTGNKTKKDDLIHLTPLKPQGSPRIRQIEDTEAELISHGRGSTAGSDTSTPVMRRQGSKMSYGSNDSSGSANSNKGKQVSKVGSTFDINSLHHASITEDRIIHNIKVTSGSDNVLFHYISFDTVEGVYLGPTPQELAASQGAVQYQVLQNFYKACLHIRKVFQGKLASKNPNSIDDPSRFGHNWCFDTTQEHGVLFRHTPLAPHDSKKAPPTLHYWVVGRISSDMREVYTCFHEAVPQSAVEIAFRLGFGS